MAGTAAFRATVIVRVAVVAAIAAITQIALTVAFTAITFRDELAVDLNLGLTAMFVGVLATAVVVGLRSGLGGHVVSPQDSGLVVLSLIAPTIAASTDAAGETIVVLMGLSSIAVGLTLFGLGVSGLGRMVRFLPYPVLAGFLAGTGLVMARSTIELAARGISGTATGGGDRVARIAVALTVTALMTAISRSSRPTEKLMPALVLGSIVTFHVAGWIAGLGRAEGADRGWLLPALPEGALVSADSFGIFTRADWGVVVDQLPAMTPLLILAPLTLLLYLGALESVLDVDIDTDREFRVIGAMNVLTGFGGSAPSYTQFANTMLVQRMAGQRRAVPVVIGLSAIVVLALGDRVVALVPQPIVAGMLGFIAASFILDWTWDLRHRVGLIELFLAAVIAVSIPVFGFLAGVGFGLVLTAAWFVVQYSQISGVRRVSDAEFLRSNAFRSSAEDEQLARSGSATLVVELDGFLFFGTGDSVLRQASTRADNDNVRWLVLDFARVTGADSSAVASFGHLLRWSDRSNVRIVWAGLRPNVQRALSPLFADERAGRTAVDLDRALEEIENDLLADAAPTTGLDGESFLDRIDGLGDHAHLIEYEPGAMLLVAGEETPGLQVIESGRVSVLGGAPGTRLRQLGPGAVLGEIGLYRDACATATVIADEPCQVLLLDIDTVERLEREEPEVAAELHRHLAITLAERLVSANDALDAFRAADAHRNGD